MWTLGEARERLTGRVGEASTDFWTEQDRNDAINDAQRFISSVTHGVPVELTGDVDSTSPYLEVPYNLAGAYGFTGTVGSRAVITIPAGIVDTIDPNLRNRVGPARWAVVDTSLSRVWVAPAPTTPTPARILVAVTPAALSSDADLLFMGNSSMSKYLGALINYAAAMLLLRERFDGDAERFYQIAVQELGSLGIDPSTIPPMPAAPQG